MINTQLRTLQACALALGTSVLAACISSPLPAGTSAELYSWQQRDQPLATREGISHDEFEGFFNGSLDFRSLRGEIATVDSAPDAPYLLKSCHESSCYYAVLFPGDFSFRKDGMLGGFASLSPLSTAMFHDVSALPAADVRPRLDNLSELVLASGEDASDYSAFIKLDYQRLPTDRQKIARLDLDELAAAQISAGAEPRLATLLNGAASTTGDLQVSEDFLFSSAWQLSIDIDLSARDYDNAYLVLCEDFNSLGDWWAVNYSNCRLKTPMTAGNYQNELKMSAATDELLAIIMPMNNPEQREAIHWVRERDGDTLEVR